MSLEKIIVISDLHIGAGKLDRFDSELESHFIQFVELLLQQHKGMQLVLNGDTFEFIQTPPWDVENNPELESFSSKKEPLCFTEQQSNDKLDAIIKAHRNIFNVLKTFLDTNETNEIVFIPGNHDVDLFWDSIRKKIQYLLTGNQSSLSNRLNFYLEQKYILHSPWEIVIEHGHQYDPLNKFDATKWSLEKPPILLDKNGQLRLIECPGTGFLLRYVNKLHDKLKNLKYIEPSIPLFLEVAFDACNPLSDNRCRLVFTHLAKYIYKEFKDYGNELLGEVNESNIDPYLKYLVKDGLDEVGKNELVRRSIEMGINIEEPLENFISNENNCDKLSSLLAEAPSILDGINIFPQGETLGWIQYPFLNNLDPLLHFNKEMNLLSKPALNIFKESSAKSVIMGHTHHPVVMSDGYYNIGSWIRSSKTFVNRQPLNLKSLMDDDPICFDYNLNYISIDLINEEIAFNNFRNSR